eukprot:916581_1
MTSSETHYTALGVDQDATQAAIRKAYLKLSLKYHPDKNPENQEQAKEQFIKIGQAYEVLSDPATRQAYDRELGKQAKDIFEAFSKKAGSVKQNARPGFFPSSSPFSTSSSSTAGAQPEKTYESYREAFDARMASMSEDEVRAALGAASMVGSVVGSLLGSGLGKRMAGNSAVGQAIFQTAGSLLGSAVGSEAGQDLVTNVHQQSRERITYEERKRAAVERGEAVPEKPKEGWSDVFEAFSKTAESVKQKKTKHNKVAEERRMEARRNMEARRMEASRI